MALSKGAERINSPLVIDFPRGITFIHIPFVFEELKGMPATFASRAVNSSHEGEAISRSPTRFFVNTLSIMLTYTNKLSSWLTILNEIELWNRIEHQSMFYCEFFNYMTWIRIFKLEFSIFLFQGSYQADSWSGAVFS